MRLTECLRKVLCERVLEPRRDGGTVVLSERIHVQGRDFTMRVEVAGLDEDAMVVRLNKVGALSGIKGGPWTKRCDYLVLNPHGDAIRVLFVELKKTWNESSEGFEQLRRSLPLLHHLGSVCKIECRAASDLEVRYALLAEKASARLGKQWLRPHNLPQRKEYEEITVALHVSGPDGSRGVHFNRLWHREESRN